LERRISKLTGEGSNAEEKIELEARLKELTIEHKAKTDTHDLLDAQIKQLQVSFQYSVTVIFHRSVIY